MDALCKSAAHRHEVILAADGTEEVFTPKPCSVEDEILRRDDIVFAQRQLATLYKAIEKDIELITMVAAIAAGCEPKPRHLAYWLQTDVQDIYNRVRRLRRRIISLVPLEAENE
jgi:hypothetical protein